MLATNSCKRRSMEEVKKNTFIFMTLILLLSLTRISSGQQTYSIIGNEKKHFVLVHGACHGAWCWYKLATLLRSAGHNVTALDQSASGINQRPVQELRSIADYFEPLMEFMESVPANERVILVGHSLGGFGISKAMETFPKKIAAAVFVTAVMPGPALDAYTIYRKVGSRIGHRPPLDICDDDPNKPPATFIMEPNDLAMDLYQLSPAEDLTLATTLVRPTPYFCKEDMNKEIAVSDENYGKVSRVFIITDEDRSLPEDIQRWMIEKNPGAIVKEIKGSDHMVMLSKPQELFSLLHQIAMNYF